MVLVTISVKIDEHLIIMEQHVQMEMHRVLVNLVDVVVEHIVEQIRYLLLKDEISYKNSMHYEMQMYH